jgi:hypothetical protein
MQPEPSDDLVFGVVRHVFGKHGVSGDMRPLQIVEKITEVHEKMLWCEYVIEVVDVVLCKNNGAGSTRDLVISGLG